MVGFLRFWTFSDLGANWVQSMRNIICYVLRHCILVNLFVLLAIPCSALTGKVISVADGDTITILDSSNQRHKIRLYGIDTPEKGQAYGEAAKKHTARLAHRKIANVKVYDTDKYGRTVGVVSVKPDYSSLLYFHLNRGRSFIANTQVLSLILIIERR